MERQNTIYHFLIGAVIVLGLVADEVLHTQILNEEVFTFPHLIVNLGILAFVARVVWIVLQNDKTGNPLFKGTGVLAAFAFLAGGIGDTILHIRGIDDGSLLARPTHVLILVGGALCLYAIPSTSKLTSLIIPLFGAAFAVALSIVLGPYSGLIILALIFGFAFSANQKNKQINDREKQIYDDLQKIKEKLGI